MFLPFLHYLNVRILGSLIKERLLAIVVQRLVPTLPRFCSLSISGSTLSYHYGVPTFGCGANREIRPSLHGHEVCGWCGGRVDEHGPGRMYGPGRMHAPLALFFVQAQIFLAMS